MGPRAGAGYQLDMFGPEGPRFSELIRQALSSTRGGYDLLAPKFDATPFRTPDALLSHVVGHLKAGPPISSALDVCCGTGAALAHLRPWCDHVVGVDFSPGMLEVARERLEAVPGGTLELVRADALELPFDAGFDLATCFGALGHFPPREQPAFLRSVFRVLVPGGRFVIVTANPPSPLKPAFWIAHGFNAVMRVRNALISPPFVMYYLEFTLAQAVRGMEAAGFRVETKPLGWSARPELQLVIGHKPR